MEQKESLRVLGLTEQSTLQDLSSTFRRLSKKYHPDLNRDREEWSNRQMRFLNEAYRTAYNYLSLPISDRIPSANQKNDIRPVYDKKSVQAFSDNLDSSLKLLYSAMETYYQYGLDNITLRYEGTRKSRFNSAVRRIKRSFNILKPLAEGPLSDIEEDILETVVHFVHYFYKSIHIRSIRAADSSRLERQAFSHYNSGSKLVDCVIKEVMFKEFVVPYKWGRLSENIKLAEAELNTVIIDYGEALCLHDTEIKKELLYAFLDLTDLQDKGLISLY